MTGLARGARAGPPRSHGRSREMIRESNAHSSDSSLVVESSRHSGAMRIPKDYRPLVKEASALGLTVSQGSRHLRVSDHGRVIATWPTSPSDRRASLNARADLRRFARALSVSGSRVCGSL